MTKGSQDDPQDDQESEEDFDSSKQHNQEDEPQDDQESEKAFEEATNKTTPRKGEELKKQRGGCLDVSPMVCKGGIQNIKSWVKEGNFVKICGSTS